MSAADTAFSRTDSRAADRAPDPYRRNWVWFSFQVVLRLVFTIWLRYRARGTAKVPRAGGALLLINHQSFLDPLLVGLPLSRPVSYLARDSLFAAPVLGWILRNTYVLPIDRDSAGAGSIRIAIDRLRHGFLVGIFPEGTRTRDGSVGEFKPGFVALVRRAKLPVYPIGIAGAFEALPRQIFRLRFARVRVVFGDPFSPDEIERLASRGREAEFVRVVRERIVACQREAEEWRRRE
ncbi:MAG: lysophospholipid acyltransferase family protein [Planctomycetales bacterium]